MYSHASVYMPGRDIPSHPRQYGYDARAPTGKHVLARFSLRSVPTTAASPPGSIPHTRQCPPNHAVPPTSRRTVAYRHVTVVPQSRILSVHAAVARSRLHPSTARSPRAWSIHLPASRHPCRYCQPSSALLRPDALPGTRCPTSRLATWAHPGASRSSRTRDAFLQPRARRRTLIFP